MMKLYQFRLLLLLAFALPTLMNAQQYTGEPGQTDLVQVTKSVKRWQVYKLDATAISEYVQANLNNNPQITLELGDRSWEIMLTPNYKMFNNYMLQVQTEDGVEVSYPSKIRAFQGFVMNGGGQVALTIDDNYLAGYIEEDGDRFFIEPLRFYGESDQNEYLLYRESEVIYDESSTCMVIDEGLISEDLLNSEDTKHDHDEGENLDCYEVDLAIASDRDMFDKYGSVGQVELHNITVINNVNTNYGNGNFTNDLEFVIVTQFVVTGSDPWTNSNNAGTLLGSFRNWGNGGGFGVVFDVGELWTDRNLSGSTIGIAYLNGVCNSNKYHVCQDFSNNQQLLRVLTAHEIGHNFSATHDTGPGVCPPSFIMCPSVNTSNNWSSQSQNQISSYAQSKINSGCLTLCASQNPPLVPGFSFNPNPACVGQQVSFTDQSTGNISTYDWVFPGGSPPVSNQPNPTVTWAAGGTYNVTLTLTGFNGQTATATEQVIINPLPVANFSSSVNGLTVTFTDLSSDGDFWSWDFGDGNFSNLQNPIHTYAEAGTYVVTLTVSNDCGTSNKTFIVNTAPSAFFTADPTSGCAPLTVVFQNESSANATSYLWSFNGGVPSTSGLENPIVTYNNSGVYSVSLTAFNSSGSATHVATNYITVETIPNPSFSFDVNGLSVQFNNGSVNADSYQWNFGDGNFSTEEDPLHIYDIGGTYMVTLSATNDCGTTTTTSTVELTPPPSAGYSANQTSGCADLVVEFEDQSAGAVNYNWQFPGGNPATSTDQNPTVTYSTPGTYDVTLIVSNNGGDDTLTMTNYITVDDVPSAGFIPTANGLMVDFDNNTTNGDSYFWNFDDGNTSTEEDPSHTYSEDGVYNVMLIATNDCGDDTVYVEVTVVTPPLAGFTPSATEGCAPLTVNFTNESSENATMFEWTFEGGDPASSTDENPWVTWNTAGTYEVTLVASNAAGSATATVTIVVDDVPTADFSSATNGLTVDFTNESDNATSYSWDFGDGNSSTEEDPSHTYSEDGTYEVVLTATNDCGSTTTTQTVTILTPPVAGIGADETEGCAPFTVNFTNESSENATTFEWTFEGGDPASSTDENPTVTWNTAGTYEVTLVASNGAGASTTTLTIIVNDVPTADFSSATNGATVDFTNESDNATSYSWDFGDGNGSTDEDPSHTYSEDGTYEVVLTATNECGSTTTTQTVTIITPPVAGIGADVTEGCLPLTVNFTNESSENATMFEWTFEGGDPATSMDENPTVTWNTAGTYEVTLVASNGAGASTTTTTIIVNDVPTADFNSASNGATVDFTNNSSGATSYSWDFGDGNGSTDENPSHTYSEDGTYEVVLTATNDCGSTTTTQTVIIETPPVAGIGADVTEGCLPLTVNFTNESSENATTFEWTFEGGDPATSMDENPTVTWNTAGTYEVTLVASNGVGASTTTMTIIVNDVPTADFSSASNGATVDFTNNSSGATSYSWDFGDGNGSSDENPSHTYNEDGTYEVVLTATNDCGSTTTTQTVTVVTPPLADFSADVTEGCVPLVVQFTNESSENATMFEWTFEGGDPAVSNEEDPKVTFNQPGTYEVVLVASNAAGASTTTMTIVVNDVPTADFTYQLAGLSIVTTNNSQDGDTYLWEFGDGNTSDQFEPTHTYGAPGNYNVILTVTNECGTATYTSEVVIQGNAPLPAFTVEASQGCAPFVVEFTDESEGDPLSWAWQFPGGNPALSTDQNPTVTYSTPGTYDVTLEVTNQWGSNTVTELQFIVVDGLPTVDFDYLTTNGTVEFTNMSQNATIYTWDFGDGNGSTDENPTHTYAADGSYIVELTATNNCGASTIQQTIDIMIVGIEDVTWVESLNLFPNPNAGHFTLQMQGEPQGELEFVLYNSIGQLVKRDVGDFSTGVLQKEFDYPALDPGVYSLGIRSGDSQLFIKIIVQ